MDENSSKNNPEKLMERAKNGDAEAFSRLYEIYFAPVFHYIYLRVKDKETAEDLMQDIFLKIFRSIRNYQKEGISPLAYFFTVARNRVIDYWRKKKEIRQNKSL